MRLIDGDALWDKAYEVWGFEADAGETSIFMDMITNAPTIDPMKHGRWTFDDFNGDGWDYQCSVCRGYARRGTKYCPDCGARMDADE